MKKILLTTAFIFLFAGSHLFAQCAAQFQHQVTSFNPYTVQFWDSSISNAFPLTYLWDFGDGSASSTSSSPIHIYTTAGTYNVCLQIQDTSGCTNTICNPVFANVPPPQIFVSFFVDSMGLFACTSPASVSFYYYAQMSGYAPTDLITFEINFGDGVDSIFQYDVQTIQGPSFNGTLTHIYQNGGNYTPQLTATAPDLQTSVQTAQTIIVSSSCGNVSGYVYDDANANCTFDAGEELANISLEIYNGNQFMGWATTDITGLYSFNVPTGNTYDIHVNANNGIIGHYTTTCPSSGILTVSTIPSTGNNFGVSCPSGYDMQGSVSVWRIRPGFTGGVCVSFFNELCDSPAGQVEVTLPSVLTPLPDSSGTYTINGNVVTYAYSGPGYYWTFCIDVQVALGAVIGDSVCIGVNISPTVGDADPSNNIFTSCHPIVGSFDPNDKQVVPAGVGVEGFILPGTDLTYTIRFQNTGNAEAINIYILDTLSANLDLNTVEVISTSHPMVFTVLSGNILRFSYDNVNLPDSNNNEPESHGFVSYRVKQIINIAHMAEIMNTAGIYFDFNAPVITNTTLNTIDQFLSVPVNYEASEHVNVYPNPSNKSCTISFVDNKSRILSVIDVLGKEVFRSVFESGIYTLSTEILSEGIYTVTITEEGFRPSSKKLVVKH